MNSTGPGRKIMVLGGARSGKSLFAENLVREAGGRRHYLATGLAFDEEMRARIDTHRVRRGPEWTLHEEPLDIVSRLRALDRPGNVVLIDCLTLWTTNLMMQERDMEHEFALLAGHCAAAAAGLVFVANEVGLGIVPENRMAREFRDHAGRLNQRIAAAVDEVYFMAAGLPLKMKG